MFRKWRNKRAGDESGFTLIELMVVVLIIAILIAIAIPTFLGAQNRARDRGAQSDLRNALTAVKTMATDHSGLFLNENDPPAEIMAGDIPEAEPALFFRDDVTHADVAAAEALFVSTATGGVHITLVARSASDTYFGISATKDGQVTYCKSAVAADCDDGIADAANYGSKW